MATIKIETEFTLAQLIRMRALVRSQERTARTLDEEREIHNLGMKLDGYVNAARESHPILKRVHVS